MINTDTKKRKGKGKGVGTSKEVGAGLLDSRRATNVGILRKHLRMRAEDVEEVRECVSE